MPEVVDVEIRRLVRATCDARGGNFIPVEDFERVFRHQTESYLPFSKFGYGTCEQYLLSMPEACKILMKRIKGQETKVVVCVEAKDVYRPAFMKHALKAPTNGTNHGTTISGGGDAAPRTFDLVFNRELNPHISSSRDVPLLFPESRGNKLESEFVFIQFAAKSDADEALDSVFDVIGLRYSEDTQRLVDENGVGCGDSNGMNANSAVKTASSTEDAKTANSVPSSSSRTSTTVKPPINNSKDAFCADCGQSGHRRVSCPKAICSDCFEEGHLAEACPLAAFDAVTSMTISTDFQKNFTRDVRDACRSAMAHISRTDSIVNNNREEIALQPSGVTCFSCGEIGHKKADCPTHGANRPIQCFRCREPGHHIKDCPRESADPVDFCLNCAREGHLGHHCDTRVDLSLERTGRCKIYLGSLNPRPTDEELEEWLRNVIGLDFCLTIVVKTNNNGRFSFIELELPLPLDSELEELWGRVEGEGVAQRMSLKAVGPENLVPSEEWGRPARTFMPILHQLGAIYRFSRIPAGMDRESLGRILVQAGLKVAKMEFFANERSANVIIADANPNTQDVARKAMQGRCAVDFIRANSHADVNGFGSVAAQNQHEQRFSGPGLLGNFHPSSLDRPPPGLFPLPGTQPLPSYLAEALERQSVPFKVASSVNPTLYRPNQVNVNRKESEPVNPTQSGPIGTRDVSPIASTPSLSPPRLPTLDSRLPTSPLTPNFQNTSMVGVGRTPKWFTKECLEEIRDDLGTSMPIVQCAEVPKMFWGTCSHVTDAARFWLVNLIDERNKIVFRSEEWARFVAMDQQLNKPTNFSKYRKVRPDHQGLCVFKNHDGSMVRGYLADGELFAIDKGEVVNPEEVEVYWYPSWMKDNRVAMQAIPMKLGDVKRVSPLTGPEALRNFIGRRKIELKMWKKQEFDAAHIVLVEAFVDGKSASAFLAERGLAELQ